MIKRALFLSVFKSLTFSPIRVTLSIRSESSARSRRGGHRNPNNSEKSRCIGARTRFIARYSRNESKRALRRGSARPPDRPYDYERTAGKVSRRDKDRGLAISREYSVFRADCRAAACTGSPRAARCSAVQRRSRKHRSRYLSAARLGLRNVRAFIYT